MKRLLEQLDAIAAIVDTVNPSQIEHDPQGVANRYRLYASSYDPLLRVKTLLHRLMAEICQGKPVNGYLSADYGYGKTATLVYLWHQCQQHQIVAVPPFKFKELDNLMVATYGWIKTCVPPERIPEIEALYVKYGKQSRASQAAELARKYRLSEDKALKIVQDLKTDITNTDSVLSFWQESIPILQQGGMKGLAIFADESQEFLRTEEGSSARIQILSNLVKGMRALGNTPVALIFSMPIDPTESAIEEQAGDIIHRMKQQQVFLRLADAYSSEFPEQLWHSLCDKFLDDGLKPEQVAHPATIESLGQLCDRKDFSNGPRTVIEVYKRLVGFVRDNNRPYTPLDLINDYLAGRVQFYGASQHRINHAINTLEQLEPVQRHSQGRDVIRLLAIFPGGLSESVAQEFGLKNSLRELADDNQLYGVHIIQLSHNRYALVALSQPNTPTVIDKILNRFRQRWFRDWHDGQKEEMAANIFRSDILPLLFPVKRAGQKGNWNWRYPQAWNVDRFGSYTFLNGAPEQYNPEFPNRSLVISVGSLDSGLMRFIPPEDSHLDWRFYLSYERKAPEIRQKITAISGTGQVDFHIQLSRRFEGGYPTVFGLLKKVIPAEHCSACTLLTLSDYIQDWLLDNPEVSKADRARLEHHRQECHQYALRLLFPEVRPDSWAIEGLEKVKGAETKLIESVFYLKCKALFPNYQSFYNNLRPSLLKYKLTLEKVPLAVRRGRQLYQVTKADFERLFETMGSGLPSVLAIFQKHGLIADYKIASKKGEISQVQFTSHSLEEFIVQALKLTGRTQVIETRQGQDHSKALDYRELWQEVKRLGYLQDEFEEAIEWLRLRRYIEWERQKGIIRQAVETRHGASLLEPDDLRGQLNEIRHRVSEWRGAFDEVMLHDVEQGLDEADKTLSWVIDSLAKDDDTAQLNLFESTGFESGNPQSISDDKVGDLGEATVVLDQLQRTIQGMGEQLEEFRQEKRSALEQELGEMKRRLENLTRELINSKVSQLIIGNSGLESCLNDYRTNLERQVKQLDKDCQKTSHSICLEDANVLSLYRQREQCFKSLRSYENRKRSLQDLVAGLEQWRIILTRAEVLRENLVNDSEKLRRYDDEFVDRVVTYFATHKIEGFREYEQLQRPLVELEQEVKRDRRSRREAFEKLLNQYQSLLARIADNESCLSRLCRFDDEDEKGSYQTLRQVFLDKLQNWCDRKIYQWEKLEQDLSFLAQERNQDVQDLLSQVSRLKRSLDERVKELYELIEAGGVGEEQIRQLQAIAEVEKNLQAEWGKLEFDKDENLQAEERQLLEAIDSLGDEVSIGKLRQQISADEKLWKQLKFLYQKGHLEITLHRRNFKP
ncbi:MAG: hypothetical protein ACOC07_20195 [Coleofasciculus sp.]|uniref:hypothetical protein n=1 Tax=Coleofasciculus sp. TaxID=3100458 RepID=UPI003A174735